MQLSWHIQLPPLAVTWTCELRVRVLSCMHVCMHVYGMARVRTYVCQPLFPCQLPPYLPPSPLLAGLAPFLNSSRTFSHSQLFCTNVQFCVSSPMLFHFNGARDVTPHHHWLPPRVFMCMCCLCVCLCVYVCERTMYSAVQVGVPKD